MCKFFLEMYCVAQYKHRMTILRGPHGDTEGEQQGPARSRATPNRSGRPKGSRKPQARIPTTVRLRTSFRELLDKICAKENLTQARVVEACLTRYGKDLLL